VVEVLIAFHCGFVVTFCEVVDLWLHFAKLWLNAQSHFTKCLLNAYEISFTFELLLNV